MEESGWGAHTGAWPPAAVILLPNLHMFMKSHRCVVHDPLTSQGPGGGRSQARATARPFLTVATEGAVGIEQLGCTWVPMGQ